MVTYFRRAMALNSHYRSNMKGWHGHSEEIPSQSKMKTQSGKHQTLQLLSQDQSAWMIATLPSPTSLLAGSTPRVQLFTSIIALASPPSLQPPTQPRIHFQRLVQGRLLRAFTQERPCHTEPGLGLLIPWRKWASFLNSCILLDARAKRTALSSSQRGVAWVP